ncbi:SH3 domain-containing protein [Loktanella sp. Alg231-35]|uniref:SH3 domain-containing protein n=1 Tax=Loktanella sp. Alg231-35 TaxID=1922220 RepID=UPI000D54B420|nr:SH3 domain-containing protein [Loktanella sp. Alg231-35]
MPFSLERTKQIEAEIQNLLTSNRLNDWERSFLGNMQSRFAKTGPKTRLSNPQYKKLHQLLGLGPENTGKNTEAGAAKGSSRNLASGRARHARDNTKLRAPRRSGNWRKSSSPMYVLNAPRRAIRRAERKLFWPVVFVLGVMGLLGSAFDTGPSNSPTRPSTASAQAVQTDSATYLYVTGDRVNQRAGPGTTNAVMGQLTKGARVRQVDEQGGWTQIVSSLGNGWMASSFLSSRRPVVAAPATPAPVRQVAVPTSREIQAARQAIIRQSIAAYPGSCPCPFNVDRGGRRCGNRSAWSRPGGYSPICYESDVSQSRLQSYFARQR